MKSRTYVLALSLTLALPVSALAQKSPAALSEIVATHASAEVFLPKVDPESVIQMKLAVDADFTQRLQYLMVMQSRVVLAETGVPSHVARAAYAKNVVNSAAAFSAQAAVMIVGGVNLIGTVTIDTITGKATTSATDAAILSQIATYWNALAGIDSGS